MRESYRRVEELLIVLHGEVPGIRESAPAPDLMLGSLFGHAEKAIEGGTPELDALREMLAAAPAVLEICLGLDTAPLDATCARACVNEAITRLWETPGGGGSPEALAAALDRFHAAVDHAVARHGERDADGNAPDCIRFDAALRERYGRPPLGKPKATGPDPVADAVRAAWEAAIAAGLDEVEATRRCLDAAAGAAAEKKNGG